jgi:hypothetical protein
VKYPTVTEKAAQRDGVERDPFIDGLAEPRAAAAAAPPHVVRHSMRRRARRVGKPAAV